MESFIDVFGRFGIPVLLLAFLCAAIWTVIRWTGKHVARPMVLAAVTYLEKQTETTVEIAESVKKTALLEQDIRNAVHEMASMHEDPNSSFSTIHTNASIVILGKAIAQVAEAVDCSMPELVIEIQRTIDRQNVN